MTSKVWVLDSSGDTDSTDSYVRGSEIGELQVRTRSRTIDGERKIDALIEFVRVGGGIAAQWMFASRELADTAATEILRHLSLGSNVVLALADDGSVHAKTI